MQEGSEAALEGTGRGSITLPAAARRNKKGNHVHPAAAAEEGGKPSRKILFCKDWTQWLVAITASLGQMAFGSCYGYTSLAIPSMKKEAAFKDLTDNQASLIGSMFNIGATVGMLMGGLGAERLGRRKSMLLTTIPFVLGWVIIAVAQNIYLIYTGRMCTGICSGILAPCCRVYIVETSDCKNRKFLTSIPGVAITIGILLEYLMGSFLSWRLTAAGSAAVSLIQFFLLLASPESPLWLLRAGEENTEAAKRSLQWLRPRSSSVDGEFEIMQKTAKSYQTQKTSYRELLRREYVVPVVLCLYLLGSVQLAGYSLVVYFSYEILEDSRSSVDPSFGTVILGVEQFLTIGLASLFLNNRFGRKPIFATSCALTTICLFLLALAFYLNDVGGWNVGRKSWIPFALLSLYMVSCSSGMTVIPWMLNAELYPLRIRGAAAGLGGAFMQFSGFVSLMVYYPLKSVIANYGVFWCLASLTAVTVPVILLLLPETKDLSIDDIENLFVRPGKCQPQKRESLHLSSDCPKVETP